MIDLKKWYVLTIIGLAVILGLIIGSPLISYLGVIAGVGGGVVVHWLRKNKEKAGE